MSSLPKNHLISILAIAGSLLILPLSTLATSDISAPSFLNSGLVGYWDMNSQSVNWTKNTMVDSSGNDNTGQLILMSTTTSPVIGKIGGALRFSKNYSGTIATSTEVYIYANNSNSLNITRNAVTISGWVNPSGLPTGAERILVKEVIGNSDPFASYGLFRIAANNVRMRISTGGAGSGTIATSNSTLPINKWTHVVGVYNGTDIRIYINGVLDMTPVAKSGNIVSTTENVTIGTDLQVNPESENWQGLLDEVRIYNRALTANEVSQLYASGQVKLDISNSKVLNTTNSLVGHWTMDASKVNWTKNTMVDSSGNGNTGQLISMSTTTSPTQGKAGGAMRFDASTNYLSLTTASSLNTTGALTISAWAYFNPLGGTGGGQNRIILGGYDGNSPFAGYGFGGSKPNTLCNDNTMLMFWDSTSWRCSATGAISVGKWIYVTAVYNGSNLVSFYKNGVLFSSTAATALASYSGTRGIGAAGVNATPSNFFGGYLDDVRIYNKALSAQEVKQLYTSSQVTIDQSNPSFLNQGLVGFWDMNNNHIKWSTNIMQDMSGNGNNGQLISMSTTTSGVIGKTGSALRFNGAATLAASSYITMTNSSSLNTSYGTISVWAKSNLSGAALVSLSRSAHIVNRKNTNPGTFNIQNNFVTGDIRCQISLAASPGTSNLVESPNVLDTKWHHYACTYDGTTEILYVDGVNVASASVSGTLDTASANVVTIGTHPTADNGTWNGFIDQVRIYNRALSANEVKQLYSSGQ